MFNRRNQIKEGEGLFNRHFKNVMDVFPLIEDREGFMIKSFSMAVRAGSPSILHEIHIDLDHSHAFTVRAGSFLHIKTKAASFISMSLAFGKFCKEISNII